MLENDEGQGEVFLGQADQVFSEQRFSRTLFLSLTAMQEWHHPLEGVFHVVLGAGLITERNSRYLKMQFRQDTKNNVT